MVSDGMKFFVSVKEKNERTNEAGIIMKKARESFVGTNCGFVLDFALPSSDFRTFSGLAHVNVDVVVVVVSKHSYSHSVFLFLLQDTPFRPSTASPAPASTPVWKPHAKTILPLLFSCHRADPSFMEAKDSTTATTVLPLPEL